VDSGVAKRLLDVVAVLASHVACDAPVSLDPFLKTSSEVNKCKQKQYIPGGE
jgi:hypothetical protein